MKFGICGGPGTNILIDIEGQLEAERTPCLKGGGQEELPHVRGQGQWPRVPDCDGAGTAERSYPVSKVRGEEPIGATPSPRSGAARRGVTPRPGSGVAAGRSYPTRPYIYVYIYKIMVDLSCCTAETNTTL